MRALVLCAGYGTRLGSLTQETPKPMLLVGGRPLLEHILTNLAQSGIKEIGINLHFQPNMIRDYFGDGKAWGIKLTYVYEPELLGTGGGVKNMETFLRAGDEFIIHYGDVITNQDFKAMQAYHQANQALVTLLVHKRRSSNSMVALDTENRVTAFLERPGDDARLTLDTPWVNSGICICDPEFLDIIPPNEASDLPRDVFPRIVESDRMVGFPLTGYRYAIDSPRRLAEAEKNLAREK